MPVPGFFEPLNIVPGISPNTDTTESSTAHYVYADKVRFKNGIPEKIGGWQSLTFDYGKTINGYARSYFSDYIDGKLYNIFGTHTRLYVSIGSRLTNITPFTETATAAPDSLDTQYLSLSSDPLSATTGSSTVIVSTTDADRFTEGDTFEISGATTFAGIPDTSLNKGHIVRAIGTNTVSINVGTQATSTTSGGGGSVVLASGIIKVNQTAHGLSDGDRIGVDGAVDTGGIVADDINKEFEIRNVDTDSFDIFTDGTATSAATSGGGSSTEYYEPLPIGLINEANSTGYGAGLYGSGLYGTALVSSTARSYPRIWFIERYGNTFTMTPGNQGAVYQWSGDVASAPAIVPNAPEKVNYSFISNNILVTFGAEEASTPIENRIFASDQADITNWTSSSTNQVYDDDIEGAGRLISHVPVDNNNLIFTNHKTYTFRYIGLPFIWEIQPLDESVGIIAPMARCAVKGIGFWMSLENFYLYRGGTAEIIPSNSQGECTALRYVFDDLNWGQKSKIFAWYNKKYDEVWFHYPSADSLECNRVVAVCLQDFTWTIHKISRTAAEYPSYKNKTPRLININTLYQHEFGTDACSEPLPFELKSPKRFYEKETINVNAVIPDSIQESGVNLKVDGYLYPQSTAQTYVNNLTVTPTTERIPFVTNGRLIQYTWTGDSLGQNWVMGIWREELQKGSVE